ncbi:MAG: hypothetical protein AAF492_20995, partial [Verrucomicrobiota bacterium]
ANWIDRSAAGNDAAQVAAGDQPTVVNNAINGLSAVRFDGNDRMIFNTIQSRTIFAVTFTDPAAAGLDGLIGANGSDFGIRREGDTGWQHPGNANTFNNGAGSTMRVNGMNTSAASEGSWHMLEAFRSPGTQAHTAIGEYFSGNNRGYNGDIAEILVYDRTLTPSEINDVGIYLANKYALATEYLDSNQAWIFPALTGQANMATNVGVTNVQVVGNVTTGATPAAGTVVYGPVDEGTNLAAWTFSTIVPGPLADGPVVNTLTGLTASTKYFYRYVTTNAAGMFIQPDEPGIFMTAGTGGIPVGVTNGLVVWLDAGILGLNNGDPVCAWPNRADNGFGFSQRVAAQQPVFETAGINGQPAVRFNNATGGDIMLQDDLSGLFVDEATVFVVAGIVNAHNYNLYSTRQNDPRWREGIFGRMGTFRNGRVNYVNDIMPTAGSHIFTVESSATNWEFWLNGFSHGTFAPQFNAGPGVQKALGGRTQDGGQRLNGNIAELIVYNRVLTETEKNA